MAYPSSLDELTDGVPSDAAAVTTALGDATYPHDDHHRALGTAVEAVQSELGTDPSGSSATVAARLDTFLVASDSASDGAGTFTVDWDGDPGTTGGIRGFMLTRPSPATKPLGFAFYTGATQLWEIGVDATTSDFVFIYDPDVPGDQLRYRKGGHLWFGLSVGETANTYRFRIDVVADDTSTLVDGLVIAGSTASSGGNFLRLLHLTNGTDSVLSVRADNKVGVGVITPTQLLHAADDQDATTQFLLANLSNTSLSRASARIQSNSKSLFLEMFSSSFTTAALRDNALIYTSSGASLILGNAAQKLGFFDSAGAVKQTGVAVTAEAMHAALVNYGLIAA